MNYKLTSLVLFFIAFYTWGQQSPLQTLDSSTQKIWVEQQLATMTLDEKIGQLFMISAYSNKDEAHVNEVKKFISQYHVGGLIFMQGTPEKQVLLNNQYQKRSKVPLLIGFDGEWGLAMRLKNTYRFPWNLTLGAIKNEALITALGVQIGVHCKRMGIHLNFAPVVDINTNPQNPIIGNRSFGESRENVSRKAIAFMEGLQSQDVLACAKHFPGHGDTAQDSHKTLPTLDFNKKRLDSVELYPFKEIIKKNVASIMAAHLKIPSIEPTGKPSSLSKRLVTNLLKDELHFKGLVITDALNMKGVTDFKDTKSIALEAFLAGNDILLFPENLPQEFKAIKNEIGKKITEEQLNRSVQKILMAKYKVGLNKYKPIDPKNLITDLNSSKDVLLHHKLVDASITLVKNNASKIPIQNLETAKVAYVKIGDANHIPFLEMLKNYTSIDVLEGDSKNYLKKLKKYSTVIIGVHKSNAHPWKSYQFSKTELQQLSQLTLYSKNTILALFTSPYSLLKLTDLNGFNSLIVAYQNSKLAQELTAQKIFGALGFYGRLPVSIKNLLNEGAGISTWSLGRLGYSVPEAVGMSSEKLAKIDPVLTEIVNKRMAPGLQVLIARKGKVIYDKTSGYHTDKKQRKVGNRDLYDVASLTKIIASLPLIMKWVEENNISLDNTLGNLLPELKGSNKENLTIKEILSHYGRLKPWIPFYLSTLDPITKLPSKTLYRKTPSANFSIKVSDNLYLLNSYKDSIFQKIKDSDLRRKKEYKYSDLPYFLFKKILEEKYQKSLHQLTQEYFYKPLGASSATYNPLLKFKKSDIVPTEKDTYYRHQLVHGYVHDMGAAMQGGIGGHAGLFANANDIAKIMQLYLQRGYYGGKQYLKPSTIEKFNQRYYEKYHVRKGVGFDKPQLNKNVEATCGCVSETSFGHSGFTGTYTWADPETEIIYVFLSNRVYPTMENRLLIKESVRTKIQQLINDAIIDE